VRLLLRSGMSGARFCEKSSELYRLKVLEVQSAYKFAKPFFCPFVWLRGWGVYYKGFRVGVQRLIRVPGYDFRVWSFEFLGLFWTVQRLEVRV